MNKVFSHSLKGTNPDIIIKQKFDKCRPTYVNYTLNHSGRDEDISSVRNDQDILGQEIAKERGHYADYVDYGNKEYQTKLEKGVDSNLTSTFTQNNFNLNHDELNELKERVNNAAHNKNIMWKTVVSLSDDFLIREKIMDNAIDRNLDQRRLKKAVQKVMPNLLKKEGLNDSAEWWGNIHLRGDENDKHVHIHLATFEEISKRQKWQSQNGYKRNQPKGVFKQKNLDSFKKEFLKESELKHSMVIEKELLIERQISERKIIDRLRQNKEKVLFKEQTNLLNTIYNVLPDNQKEWRAKSNAVTMKTANSLADKFIDNFLTADSVAMESDEKLKRINEQLQSKYQKKYGLNQRTGDYSNRQSKLLKQQLVNELYRSLRNLPNGFVETEYITDNLIDHQEIKNQLTDQIAEMKRNKQQPPKKVLRELGKQKNAIRKINAKSEIEEIEGKLLKLSTAQKTQFSNFYQSKFEKRKRYLELSLVPSYKLSEIEKETRRKLRFETLEPENANVNDVSEDYHLVHQKEIANELSAIQSAGDSEITILFPSVNGRNDLINQINRRKIILEDKGVIFDNNLQLTNKQNINNQELKNMLLNENKRRFERIKAMEAPSASSSGTINKEISKKNMHSLKIRKKLKVAATLHVLERMAAYDQSKDVEKEAQKEYEEEQERIKQIERQKEYGE